MRVHFPFPRQRSAGKRGIPKHKRRWLGVLPRLEQLEERAVPTTWTGGGGNPYWFNRFNWDTMTVPGSGDMVTIPENSPEVLLAEDQGQPTTVAGLTMSGVMEMRTSLIVRGPMSWTKGLINADGAHDVHLQVQGLFLSGSDPKSLIGNINVDNSALLDWSGGDLIAHSNVGFGPPRVANSGTVSLNDDVSLRVSDFPPPEFSSAGTLRKHGGTGVSTIGGSLTVSGPVMVESGTLALNGSGTISGPVSLSAGRNLSIAATYTLANTTVTGPGTLSIDANGTLKYSGNVTVENLRLATNSLLTIPTGQLAMLTVSGTMDWIGGTISSGHVVFSRTLTIHGDDDKFVNGCWTMPDWRPGRMGAPSWSRPTVCRSTGTTWRGRRLMCKMKRRWPGPGISHLSTPARFESPWRRRPEWR